MADIKVVEAHHGTPTEAIAKIGAFEDMLSKYGIKPKWSGHTAAIKAIGVSGNIGVDDTNVTVELSLGRMAKMAGIDPVKLEGSIRKRLKAAFATE
jgi:putative polyhydroxyalkanoate system protein